jgi:prevent-host-death family protein
MTTVSIKEARNRLTALARLVEKGKTVTVTRNGKPVLDLVPHKKKGGLDFAAGEAYLRKRGMNQTKLYIAEDFDEPLPEDFLLRPLP